MTHKMKLAIFLSITGILSISLSACSNPGNTTESPVAHTEHSRMGSHGMAVIGDTDLLLVHMALYRRPHDRQILTPASLEAADKQAAFADWRASYKGLVTIVPENFDLDRLAPGASNPISTFSADIYEGHFERGGTVKFETVIFNLGEPLLHLDVTESAPAQENFTYLQHKDTAYLVRHIGPRPGKDEILQVSLMDSVASGETLRTETRRDLRSSWSFIRQDGSPLSMSLKETAYLETSDFSLPQ